MKRTLSAAAAVLLLAGCTPALRGTPREQLGQMRGRDVEATLRSGARVVLRSPVIEGDSVFGGWTAGPAGDQRAAVAIADIERLRPAPEPPEKRTARKLIVDSLLIGFAGIVALMASFAIFGM